MDDQKKTLYTCERCNAVAEIVLGQVKRSCACPPDTMVIAHMSATIRGRSSLAAG